MYQITATNGDRDPLDVLDDLIIMNRFLFRAAELAITGEGGITETEATGFYTLYTMVTDGLDAISRRQRDALRTETTAGVYPNVAQSDAADTKPHQRKAVHPAFRTAAG